MSIIFTNIFGNKHLKTLFQDKKKRPNKNVRPQIFRQLQLIRC